MIVLVIALFILISFSLLLFHDLFVHFPSGSNDPEDIVYKLMRADIIVKKQRKQRLDEKLQAIETDAMSLFSEESSNEVINACKQLVGYIKQHHTSDNVQSLTERIKSMDCIALDSDARRALDQCVLNLEDLHNCRYDRSMIKESVEKLVMKAKFNAMKMTNECKALGKKMQILMHDRKSLSKQEDLSRSSVVTVDDNEGKDIQDVVKDLSISERELKSMENSDLDTLD